MMFTSSLQISYTMHILSFILLLFCSKGNCFVCNESVLLVTLAALSELLFSFPGYVGVKHQNLSQRQLNCSIWLIESNVICCSNSKRHASLLIGHYNISRHSHCRSRLSFLPFTHREGLQISVQNWFFKSAHFIDFP